MKVFTVSILLALGSLTSTSLHAFTPESPEVVRMVDRGLAFLAGYKRERPHSDELGSDAGHDILSGYTAFKVNHDPSDPLVRRGVESALKFIQKETGDTSHPHHKINYISALAILLLLDVDHVKYESQINRIANYFFSQQKAHGGFGYPNASEGDNSQNQYAVLAIWSLGKKGFDVPAVVMERVAIYLLRTQDPSGMWGYYGNLAPQGGLVPQQRTRMSLASAGAGSLLIAGDFFGFYGDTASKRKKKVDDGLPQAVQLYDEVAAKNAQKFKASQFNLSLMQSAVGRTLGFYNKNSFRFSNFPNAYGYYYYALYAHERFMSFHEMSTGNFEEEPGWYNQAVQDLAKLQESDGSWGGKKTKDAGKTLYLSVESNTALAILFLIRSTKRAIGELSAGTMQGGYGLPTDTKNMQTKGGQLIEAPKPGSVSGMLDLLEQGGEDVDDKAIYDSLILSKDPQERADQLKRLKRMIKGGPYKTRRAAARMLGQSSDMDIVPTLIFALTDPDTTVRREARNGLRFVSRKFEGFGLPDDPTEKQVQDAVKAWKQWYLQANPSHVFLDET